MGCASYLVIIFIIDNLLLTVNDIHRVLQHAEKVVSDSTGLVDFAIGLVSFVLNLPDRQVLFLGGKFKLQKDCNLSC